jgi:hypothetical protein
MLMTLMTMTMTMSTWVALLALQQRTKVLLARFSKLAVSL